MGDHDAMIGAVLEGRYQLTAHMSTGRFGDFWQAKRLEDGAPVAVKLLKLDLFSEQQALARFDRETRLLVSWRHPNLLRVLDYGRTHTGHPWLVTELPQGRSLYDEIAFQRLTVEIVCHIAGQIARTIAAAHARGIIHRGLEPDAIFLCEEKGDPFHVKVLDFGLAHLTAATGEEALTRVGERIGRAEYMAPEYIGEFRLDGRSDIYALGILTFEMLAAQPPFVGPARRVYMKHMVEDPPSPSELSVLDVPPWLDELVLALLEKEPEDRPQELMDVASAFSSQRWPLPA